MAVTVCFIMVQIECKVLNIMFFLYCGLYKKILLFKVDLNRSKDVLEETSIASVHHLYC